MGKSWGSLVGGGFKGGKSRKQLSPTGGRRWTAGFPSLQDAAAKAHAQKRQSGTNKNVLRCVPSGWTGTRSARRHSGKRTTAAGGRSGLPRNPTCSCPPCTSPRHRSSKGPACAATLPLRWTPAARSLAWCPPAEQGGGGVVRRTGWTQRHPRPNRKSRPILASL